MQVVWSGEIQEIMVDRHGYGSSSRHTVNGENGRQVYGVAQ